MRDWSFIARDVGVSAGCRAITLFFGAYCQAFDGVHSSANGRAFRTWKVNNSFTTMGNFDKFQLKSVSIGKATFGKDGVLATPIGGGWRQGLMTGQVETGFVEGVREVEFGTNGVNTNSAAGDTGLEGEAAVTKPAGNELRVRLFEEGDIPAARKIMHQHHANTIFRNQPFSDRKLDRHFRKILSRPPRMVGIVVEWQGEPVGVAWAQADSYMLTEEPLCVTVHVIAVDLTQKPLRRAKAFLALIGGLKKWAASLNAGPMFIHVTTGSSLKSTDRLLRAGGAQCVGGAYVV